MADKSKSPNLTDEQNDICYEIQFALIRSILNLDHDKMWAMIQKAIDSGKENK